MSEQNISLTVSELIPKIHELAAAKARFVTITCLDLGKEFEVIYHFEKDSGLVNVKVRVGKEGNLPTITTIYPCAFLAENEVRDMFGLKFTGLNPDFNSRLLRTAEDVQTTLLKPTVGVSPPMFRTPGRCAQNCPARIDVPKYVRLIAEGRFEEALETILEQNPLAAICGRVCFAPCEDGCRQAKKGEPISIRLLKRYVADVVGIKRRDVKRAKPTGKKVAVVGAGPAGVTAAYYLGLLGHDVTVFDELPKPGGMMLVGIPQYRLPKDVMEAEIRARLEEAEADLKLNTKIESLDELFKQGFDAIFVATGAHKGASLRIEGEDHPRLWDCIDFLREVNLHGRKPDVGEKVVVIGGGNSAVDAARVSLRLGAKEVAIYYRRTRNEMPATPSEVADAEEEGVKLEFLVAPTKVLGGEKPVKMEFIKMKLGAPDASGRPRPEPIPRSEFTVEADTFIKAIGQVVTVPEGFNLKLDRRGQIQVNPETLETSMKGVFAGGDAVTGPASVVEAIAAGKKAASAIDRYLGGKGLPEPAFMEEFVPRADVEEVLAMHKVSVAKLPHDRRIKTFEEVELGYSKDEAVREAKRCWRCDWYE
ncbi:MAG: hypothetical protein DRO46_01380 [Candidatus Hecatellales archaeon]|nr:MAG: hypothetical protein DRO46_01380 [Candidatus Hecatellales archaeon]